VSVCLCDSVCLCVCLSVYLFTFLGLWICGSVGLWVCVCDVHGDPCWKGTGSCETKAELLRTRTKYVRVVRAFGLDYGSCSRLKHLPKLDLITLINHKFYKESVNK
jgi:hypothetical protein